MSDLNSSPESALLLDESSPAAVESAEDALRAHVLDLLANPDPDGPAYSWRAAWRDLGCKGSGPECYRRVAYPAAWENETIVDTQWPDCDRLPERGMRASERRATVHMEIPEGTLVVSFERNVYHGSRGRCSVSFALAVLEDGKSILFDLKHKTLRSRPYYEVSLPNGRKIFVERREH